jgi:hypothetical protein
MHEPALLQRSASLRDILGAAALSAEIARLRVEVRLQLKEVEASRARIVEAGYEERRRLERDLHDDVERFVGPERRATAAEACGGWTSATRRVFPRRGRPAWAKSRSGSTRRRCARRGS